ncbi:hypothetical protein [Synechococcus elongatus]|uniref:hypothetical protein n=1 Tax=Synechococcus elongatus TaxID=32046 RepID=UPI0030D53803
MKQNRLLTLSTILSLSAIASFIATSAQAQPTSFPYRCEWKSEVTPDAVIRFNSTNGVGTYNGALFYKGRRLLSFSEGFSQGYGSNFWRAGSNNEQQSSEIVRFSGNQPRRSYRDPQAAKTNRVLIVGLGSRLWYGENTNWRREAELLRAAEGFWRLSQGCI